MKAAGGRVDKGRTPATPSPARSRKGPPGTAERKGRLSPSTVRQLLTTPAGPQDAGGDDARSRGRSPRPVDRVRMPPLALVEYSQQYGPMTPPPVDGGENDAGSGAPRHVSAGAVRGYRIAPPPAIAAPTFADDDVDLNEFDGYRKIKRNLGNTTQHIDDLHKMFEDIISPRRRRSSASSHASAESGRSGDVDSDDDSMNSATDFEKMSANRTQRLQQEMTNAFEELAEKDAKIRGLQEELYREVERRADVQDDLDMIKTDNLRLMEELHETKVEINELRGKLDSTRKQLEVANEDLARVRAETAQLVEEAKKEKDPFASTPKDPFDTMRDASGPEAAKQREMEAKLEKAYKKRSIPKAGRTAKHANLQQIAREAKEKQKQERAPEGKLALVFTDIQGSTNLWEKLSERMHVELAKHNDTMRDLIKEWGGYEVKTQGDSFMVAFTDVTDAVCWCLAVQVSLMDCTWDPLLDSLPDAHRRVVFDKTLGREIKIWNGLRVRMGLHYGIPICQRDPTSGRMDYFGPMVNQSARVQGIALGGMISLTQEVRAEIDLKRIPQHLKPRFEDIGTFSLKGIEVPVQLQQILPVALGPRLEDFGPLQTDKKKHEDEELHNVPDGLVTVVFTTVENAFQLEKDNPKVYHSALKVYLNEIQCSATVMGGYVSRVDGCRCTIVFHVPGVAFRFAMELQEQLNVTGWPDALVSLPGCESVVLGSKTILCGLRVQIGLHMSPCEATYDSVSRKATYLGEAVTVAALMAEDAAGGETHITQQMYDEVSALHDTFVQGQQGMVFEGVSSTFDGYYCFPKSMPERANYLMEGEVAQIPGQRGEGNVKAVTAPIGNVALVFTDVQNSTALWETDEAVMAEAVKLHHLAMRAAITKFHGYEVKTEGDAFMVAFHSASDAFRWCLYMQEKLLHLEYPQALLDYDDAREVKVKNTLVWRGLRVRMGVHCGCPQCEVDPVTGRMDYYGQMVNKAARVSGLAKGGQISLSEEVHSEIKNTLREMGNPHIVFGGEVALKGIKKRAAVFYALPLGVKARQEDFAAAQAQAAVPAPAPPGGSGDQDDTESVGSSRPSTANRPPRKDTAGDAGLATSGDQEDRSTEAGTPQPSSPGKGRRGGPRKAAKPNSAKGQRRGSKAGEVAAVASEEEITPGDEEIEEGGIGKMMAVRIDGPKVPEAPTGRVAISFTDIQNSTVLWENCSTMRETVTHHHRLMREGIRKFNGYEVKTEGDAFMVCFYRTVDGVGWCLHMQRILLEAQWSGELLGMNDAQTETDGSGRVYWNGPRVRMGLHVGEKPDLGWERDECTGRMDYYGRMVNKAARVSGLGKGGEIILSQDCMDELDAADPADLQGCTYSSVCIGEKKLKGIEQGVTCYSIVDPEFEARRATWEEMNRKAEQGKKKEEVDDLFEKYQAELNRKEEERKRAPKGEVTIVFTDVQSSTKLWDTDSAMMAEAVRMHHELFRRLISRMGGYEVKTEGDAFMVAFHNPTAACKWCIAVQKELLEENWPEELLNLDLCRTEHDENERVIWRGLRVRMGFHHGQMESIVDPTTERMDYYGPNVNAAARVGGIGTGGEIIVSEECVDLIDPAACGHPIIQYIDTRSLKGITQEFSIFRVTPLALSAREFEKKEVAAPLPPQPRRRSSQGRKMSRDSSDGLDGYDDDGLDSIGSRHGSVLKHKKDKREVVNEELSMLRSKCKFLERMDQDRQFEVLRIHQHIRLFMHLMRKFCECTLDRTKGVFSQTDMTHEWIKQHRLIMSLESPLDTTGQMRRDKKLPKPNVEIKHQRDLAIETFKEEVTHVSVNQAEGSWAIATSKLSRSIVGHLSKHFLFINSSLIAPLAKGQGRGQAHTEDRAPPARQRRRTIRFDKGALGTHDDRGGRSHSNAEAAAQGTSMPVSPLDDSMQISGPAGQNLFDRPQGSAGQQRATRAQRMSMFAVAHGVVRMRRGSSQHSLDVDSDDALKPRRTTSGRMLRKPSEGESTQGGEPVTPIERGAGASFDASDGGDGSPVSFGGTKMAYHRPTAPGSAERRRLSSFSRRQPEDSIPIARGDSFKKQRRVTGRASNASGLPPRRDSHGVDDGAGIPPQAPRFSGFARSPFAQSGDDGHDGTLPAMNVSASFGTPFGSGTQLPPRHSSDARRGSDNETAAAVRAEDTRRQSSAQPPPGRRGVRGRMASIDDDVYSPTMPLARRPVSGRRRSSVAAR